tara:strand:+ start:994 stop:1308 length:315 start_codon:yes stop_codon:yes gene_type:complete
MTKIKNLDLEVLNIINKSIDEVNKLNKKYKLSKKKNSTLIGTSSNLDSLGLVNLILNIEKNIEEKFSLSLVLADEKAMSQERSPFRDINSLKKYICLMVKNVNK